MMDRRLQLSGALLAAALLGGSVGPLAARPAAAQENSPVGAVCQVLDTWQRDPEGAVNETLIVIGHGQNDDGTAWARANAQRVVNNTIYDYVRSRPEKDLNLTDVEKELTDSITSAVQGPEDAQTAARERLGRVLSIDIPAFLARAVPSCANADTPLVGD